MQTYDNAIGHFKPIHRSTGETFQNSPKRQKSDKHQTSFGEPETDTLVKGKTGLDIGKEMTRIIDNGKKQKSKQEMIDNLKREDLFSEPEIVEEFKKQLNISPLVMATELRDWGCVRSLLEKGIDVDDAPEDGGSALLHSIKNMDYDIAEKLLERGANLDKKNFGDLTARELAMMIPDYDNDSFGCHREEIEFKKLILSMK